MSQNGATRTERLDAIRSHLYTHGFSSIQALADAVGASLATIRRDLQVLEGEDAIAKNREVMGATNPADAAPGTIRGDLARQWSTKVIQNIVHGSDSPESAEREIGIWFPGL